MSEDYTAANMFPGIKKDSPVTAQVRKIEDRYLEMQTLCGEIIAMLIINFKKCPDEIEPAKFIEEFKKLELIERWDKKYEELKINRT